MNSLIDHIKNKLLNSPNLSKIMWNIIWLVFDKLLKLGFGLLVTILLSRYLGPEKFGILNYALALIALLFTFTNFGLNNIAVKNLTHTPEKTNEILGSVFIIQFILACLVFSIFTFFVVTCINNYTLKLTLLILGLTTFSKPFDTIKYYFEAQVLSKYIVLSENIAFIVCSILKILFILNGASYVSIIWLFFLDICSATVLVIIYYHYTHQHISNWKVNFQLVKQSIQDSWPLFFSGISIILYMRLDQIMLGQMLDYESVGIYSAATRISEIWYFIPVIIVASANPYLIALQTSNEKEYIKKLQFISSILIALSLAIAIFFTMASHFIIHLLYGEQYQSAAHILIIHIWTGIFVSFGIIGNQWLITKGFYSYQLHRTLLGLVINIFFNLILIPSLGGVGAALATLLAQASSTMFFDLFNPKTRLIFYLKLKSLNIYDTIKQCISLIKI